MQSIINTSIVLMANYMLFTQVRQLKTQCWKLGSEVCLQTDGEVKNRVGSGCQGGSHTQLWEALW